MTAEDRLRELNYPLPEAVLPLATYVPAVKSGHLIFTSGQLPTRAGELVHRGQVGIDVTTDEAYVCARVAVLNALAAVSTIVPLDSITRVIRLTGYVNSAPGFVDQPTVINGASDLLLQVFGDAGRHSRAAIGVSQLPRDAPVEIDIVVEVE